MREERRKKRAYIMLVRPPIDVPQNRQIVPPRNDLEFLEQMLMRRVHRGGVHSRVLREGEGGELCLFDLRTTSVSRNQFLLGRGRERGRRTRYSYQESASPPSVYSPCSIDGCPGSR